MTVVAEKDDAQQRIAFKNVLLATDFSLASQRALSYAMAIARRYAATLTVINAIPLEPRDRIPLDPLPRELSRRLLEAAENMKQLETASPMNDLEHHFLLERGRVWDVLGAVMQRDRADLLVLGTHGRGGLKKLALGSIAEEVLRLAPCPVLTIGPHVPPANSERFAPKRILFATDFGPTSAKAFPYALMMAEDCGAKLTLLHMGPPRPSADLGPSVYGPSTYAAEEFLEWQQSTRCQSQTRLRGLVPIGAKLAEPPECVAGLDFLADGILEFATAKQVDLMVMGASRTPAPRIAAHIPWTLTHEVICSATCPVLTVSS